MKFRLFVLFVVLTSVGSLFAQKSEADLTKQLPLDPSVRVGKLENGLVYYIRKNKKPENRLDLRLVVNAGSVLENDDQQGLAHFLEHMCFNGTKNFPKNQLVDFLQKTGVKFGADINAYTSFDETVYMLEIPSDKSELVEKGYQVIEDWAHNVTLDGKEIDNERGVIEAEWRLGLGADDRMRKKYFPVIFKDSRYADRVPIGKVDIIRSFKHETIRNFYKEWYRPDLMAVIVVGNLNLDSAEAKIKQHFSGIKNPENVKPRPVIEIPNNKEPLVAIATDKEATSTDLMIFWKHPHQPLKTMGDYKAMLIRSLYNGMLNARMNELSKKPDAPYVMASCSYGGFLNRTNDTYAISAMPKENQIEKTMEFVLSENERVKRFGFLASEFERQKEELLSNYETMAKEADKTENGSFTDEYTQHFLRENAAPGIKNELKYAKKFIPEITLEDVNKLAAQWITDENVVIVVTAPEKSELKVPTQDQLIKILKNSKSAKVEPWIDNFKAEPLITDELTGVKVKSRKEFKNPDYTEVTLNNGIKVVLKPTEFKNDEILFKGYSLGGSSLCADKDFPSANFASTIVDQSGIGNFDNSQLQKKLKGKVVNISPYISALEEGFDGSCSPKDLETMLQLTYLYFKAPRKDTAAFQTFVSQTKNQLKFIKASPIMAFYDTLFKVAYPNSNRLIIFPSEEILNKIDLNVSYDFYKDRFADASDFTFFFVGNFNIDSITPMLEKYLGSLPVINRKETWLDKSPKFNDKLTNVTIQKGTDPQSMVGILMSGPMEWNDKNRMSVRFVEEVLSIKLIEVIREKLAGVYSPQVNASIEQFPTSEYNLTVMFGCSPKGASKISKAVFKEMKKIAKKGPTQVDLDKVKELLIRERETNLNKNEYWISKLESAYINHDDLSTMNNYDVTVKAMTIEDVKMVAQKMLTTEKYVRTVLMPEPKTK